MLSALIKKGWFSQSMTATPATVATVQAVCDSNVAEVATVAVANLPAVKMSAADEALILAWLKQIGETDECEIERVLEKCRADIKVRQYVLEQAAETARLHLIHTECKS